MLCVPRFFLIFSGIAHAGQSYSSGTVFKETWGASSGAELCWTDGPTNCNQPWINIQTGGTGQSIVTAPSGMPSGNALKMQIAATGTPTILETAGSFPLIPTSTAMDINFTLDVTSSSIAAYDNETFLCVGDPFIGTGCNGSLETAALVFTYDGSNFSIYANASTTSNNVNLTLNTHHTVHLHIAGASSYVSVDGGASSTFAAFSVPVNVVEFGLDGGNQDVATYYIGSDFAITASGMNGSWPPSELMDWAGQSGTPTANSIVAGTHCGNAPAANIATSTGNAPFTFTAGGQAFLSSLSLCGASYPGTSNVILHMAIPSSTTGVGGFETISYNTAYSSSSVGFYFRWNTNTGANLQFSDMAQLGNGDSNTPVNLQLNGQEGDGKEHLLLETDWVTGTGGASNTYIAYGLASSTWYWATFDINASTTDKASLYDTSGNLLGTSNFNTPMDGFTPGQLIFEIGKTGNENEPVPGYIDYSNVIVDYADAVFPLLPPAAPPSCAFSTLLIDACSTDFFVRGQTGSILGNANSTDFSIYNNGQVLALPLMTSADFWILSGTIKPIFQPVKPAYTQIHYQWRNDNGSETGATSATGGIEDTALSSVAQNTSIRLRMEITNAGGTIFSYAPQSFQLQYGKASSTALAPRRGPRSVRPDRYGACITRAISMTDRARRTSRPRRGRFGYEPHIHHAEPGSEDDDEHRHRDLRTERFVH